MDFKHGGGFGLLRDAQYLDYIASMVSEVKMSTGEWWKAKWQGTTEVAGEKTIQVPIFVHHESILTAVYSK